VDRRKRRALRKEEEEEKLVGVRGWEVTLARDSRERTRSRFFRTQSL
jgi:hypothetical protein